MVVTRGDAELRFHGYRVLAQDHEKVLEPETHGGDDCITL